MADLTEFDSPPAGGTADAPVSNTGPSGGEGSTPSPGTVEKFEPFVAEGWLGPDGSVGVFERDSAGAVIGHKVLSARVRVDDVVHFHAADLVGDAYYVDGVRMKRAECRICGKPLEARRA